MDVYDQNGEPLEEYDLDKGYLKEETETVHHEAVEGVEEQGHWETVREYPETGGKDVEWVVDVPGVEAREAWDEEITRTVYVPYTPEELAARERQRKTREEQQKRTVAIQEAQAMLITAQINTLTVDDATALRWRALYPAWGVNTSYAIGDKVQYGEHLYKCLQGHTSQAGWEPESVPALWTEICESHAGTEDDPVPYSGNMALESGKYYSQDGVTYRCTRDTGVPVYHPLAQLVGLYVEVAEG